MKKFLIFLLCVCFLFPCINSFAESDVSVDIAFSTDSIEVENETAVIIKVSGNVKKVKANIEYNNYFFNYRGSGLGFDINSGEYTITFVPSSDPYMLYCSASNSGNAQITFKNVICETDAGDVNLGNITAKVTVTPKYTHIYTKEDLNNVRNDLSGAYLLMNDIKFTPEDFLEGGAFYNDGFGWIPIGAVVKEPFMGEFNGNGHTISGLTINKAYYNYCGLFGVNRGNVTSLRLTDTIIDGKIGLNMSVTSSTPDISGDIDYEDKNVWTEPDDSITADSLEKYDRTGKSTANIGIVCGFNLGTVKKCFVSGEISGNNSAGGITGRNGGKISQCATDVTINDAAVSGGIVGITNAYSNIIDCVADGTIGGTLSGGIAGSISGTVQRVYSTVKGTDLESNFGKISGATIVESYAFGQYEEDGVTVIKPLEELIGHRFNGGEWNYDGERPYPTPLADLIERKLFGDINGDGAVDTVDLATLKLSLAGLAQIDATSGDVNSDGAVDTVDLALLKLKLAGIE